MRKRDLILSLILLAVAIATLVETANYRSAAYRHRTWGFSLSSSPFSWEPYL